MENQKSNLDDRLKFFCVVRVLKSNPKSHTRSHTHTHIERERERERGREREFEGLSTTQYNIDTRYI
jgi:hypothetical protein